MSAHVVDRAAVQALLPSGVTAQDRGGGRAVLGLAVLHCDDVTALGSTAEAYVSDVGVFIEPPPGEPQGTHLYQLWQLTDHLALAHAMDDLGVRGGLVAASYAADEVAVRASLPWGKRSYAMTVTAPSPPQRHAAGPVDDANTWWHHGDRGVVRTGYDVRGALLSAGASTVETSPRSPLAAALGGSPASGAGLRIAVASVTGTVVVVR